MRKQRHLVTIVLAASAVLLLAAKATERIANVSPAFETHVSILPSTQYGSPLTYTDPPTFTCSAEVVQPGTNRAYCVVGNVVVRRGASRTVVKDAGEFNVKLAVTINASGDRAESTIIVLRGADVLSRQHSTVWLQKTNGGVVPGT